MFDHLLPDRIWLTSTTSSSADLFVLIPDHISPITAYRKGDVRCCTMNLRGCDLFPTSALQHRSQSLALSFHGSTKDSYFCCFSRSRTVHVIEEGPREQRNQLFSVLGSLTGPEEEESKESSEILNYQEEEVCKWSSVATHAEREELNGLSTVWLMNVALSLSSVVDVLSIISWLRILVIVEYDFRKKTSKDSRAGAGGRVIGVSTRGGEAGGGDAGWGEAGASGGETVEAGTRRLCGGCGGGATGLITGSTFGAGGGETVGVTAGGGVVRDAGGRVAETGGTTVVGGVA
ncbi:unnamed protein product [Brassica oleracea var. botrytis]